LYRFFSPDSYRDGEGDGPKDSFGEDEALLSREQNVQDMPSLLVAQATTAVEECDATKLE